MVDWLMYWTGALLWACGAALLAYRVFLGLATAADLMVWVMRCRHKRGKRVLWLALPRAFARAWWRFTLTPDGTEYYLPEGSWKGFLRGQVYDFSQCSE